MDLNPAQLKNREYNLSQSDIGHSLKTLKGSVVKRSRFGIGKLIGGQLYFHREYAEDILDKNDLQLLEESTENCPFNYNTLRYDLKTDQLALVESPDFDTAREPVVGRMLIIEPDGTTKLTKFFNQIYHHKWLWVDNSYTGFDVAESWEWSKEWLSTLTEPADGTNLSRWIAQLNKFGLN